MDKPVSEPTAPAEPLSAFEQNFPHWSDCARHNEPAYPAEPCDCGMDQIMKDAERYRWLRENWLDREIYDVDYGNHYQLKGYERLDAAIDAAMKG